ncbi:MAG: hypothetical protein LBV80_05925 [Deltaproteobacteria bacterium]|nr:hypothetical protein [Deltaproteobacteria bacterium]
MSTMNVHSNTPVTGTQAALAEQIAATTKNILANDMGGVGGTGSRPFLGKPSLPAPTLSATSMMVALTALNSRIAGESITFGESAIEGMRNDIREQAAKRTEQLQQYFDNMNKVNNTQKCGLFGAIGLFFSNLFKGDPMAGLEIIKNNIGNIVKDVVMMGALALSATVAIAATVATVGAAAPSIALVAGGATIVLAAMVFSDPAITGAITNMMPENIRMGVSIAMAVITVIASIVGGVMMAVGSGGTSALTNISAVVSSISTLVGAASTLEQGVKGFIQSGYQTESMLQQAEMDKTDALMADIKSALERNQTDLRVIFDAFAKMVESTHGLIQTYGQNLTRAASV